MTTLTPDHTILGLLAAKPQHGYQILESFNDPQQLGSVWRMSTSQIYAVLKRLETQGWISGHELASQNAPSRIEYAIADKGRKHLLNWLHDPHPSSSIRRVRVEFLSRLYITRLLGLPIETVILHQHTACKNERDRLLQLQQEQAVDVGWLTSELVIAQLEAILQWIDRCALAFQPISS
jgi:DNA-binding PadR family transcriptional regulator